MGPDGAVHGAWQSAERRVCVLISFIHNLGLTIKPIKGPPQGVYACPHNKKLATLLNNKQCVCVCVCVPPSPSRPCRPRTSWCRRSASPGAIAPASSAQAAPAWCRRCRSARPPLCSLTGLAPAHCSPGPASGATAVAAGPHTHSPPAQRAVGHTELTPLAR
jgi:hypothetical protein